MAEWKGVLKHFWCVFFNENTEREQSLRPMVTLKPTKLNSECKFLCTCTLLLKKTRDKHWWSLVSSRYWWLGTSPCCWLLDELSQLLVFSCWGILQACIHIPAIGSCFPHFHKSQSDLRVWEKIGSRVSYVWLGLQWKFLSWGRVHVSCFKFR